MASDSRDSPWVPVGPDEPFFHRFRAATQSSRKNALAGTIDHRARCLSALPATSNGMNNCFSCASRFVLRNEEQGPLEQFIDGNADDDDEDDSEDTDDDDGPRAPEGDAEGVIEGKDEVVDIAARGIRFRASLSAGSYNGTSIGVVGRRTWNRLIRNFTGEGFCARWGDGDVQPPVLDGSTRKQHAVLKPGGAFLYSLEVLPGEQNGRLHVIVLPAQAVEDLEGAAEEGAVWEQTTFSDEDMACAAVALDSIPYISVYGDGPTGAPSMTVSDLEIIPLSTPAKSARKR
jgi:hypothetical protein